MSNPHIAAGRNALKQADRAARRGDLVAAERWSKAAERLAEAAERLANTPEPEPLDSEAARAELLAWITSIVDANNERLAWLAERDDYLREVSDAARSGAPAPPPLRDAPVTEADLMEMVSVAP